MAKARIGLRLDRAGIGQLMKSPELASVLESVAQDVAGAAGDGYAVVVEYDRRTSRVISMVTDSDGFGREIATGNLARAVGSKESGWKR
jgi:hypothetical protein